MTDELRAGAGVSEFVAELRMAAETVDLAAMRVAAHLLKSNAREFRTTGPARLDLEALAMSSRLGRWRNRSRSGAEISGGWLPSRGPGSFLFADRVLLGRERWAVWIVWTLWYTARPAASEELP